MSKPYVIRPSEGERVEDDYVEFWPAGTAATGRFRCTACGNSVTVRWVLPRCLLCGERLWERAERGLAKRTRGQPLASGS
jgi:hypothetical protein